LARYRLQFSRISQNTKPNTSGSQNVIQTETALPRKTPITGVKNPESDA
jgi:hypothetical protein